MPEIKQQRRGDDGSKSRSQTGARDRKIRRRSLARAGAQVVLAGRRKQEGEAVVGEIKAGGGEAHFVQTDVTKEDQLKRLVDQASRRSF